MMTVQECIKYVEDHLEVRYATESGAYQSGRTIVPDGAVNHSVGCAQPKVDVFFKSMNKSSAGWSTNAILGDFHLGEGRILLTLKYNSRPGGCGTGKNGSWNNSKVQWEVCEPAGHTYAGGTMVNYDVAKNQEYFDRMWKMLVCWNVYMANMFGYPIENIKDHAESYKEGYGSNHSDMGQWLPKHGKSMDALRKEVQAIFDYTKKCEEEETTKVEEFTKIFNQLMDQYRAELQDNDASAYSAEAREWARKTGIVQGSSTTEFNGMWKDFITREQMVTILYRFGKTVGLI